MEYEVRFYYPTAGLNELITKLLKSDDLKMGLRTYEKTVQFNHCDPNYDFYSKEIDGRFRVRISSNDKETKCKLSWKRRLPNTTETNVNKEEEVELEINPNEYDIDMVALMCMPAQQEDIKAHIRKIAPDVTILEGDSLNGLFN